jgi:hypothetical protein
VIVGLVVSVYIINTLNTEQARVEAENQAIEAQREYCNTWSDEIEDKRAILDARQDSLVGKLDLDGSTEGMRLQFNQEVERWNEECAI